MQAFETVTIGSSFGFAGVLVLVVAIFAAVLKYAGRVLYALGPVGILILFLLIIVLPIVPAEVLGSDVGFLIPLIVIMAMLTGWLLYVAGNPNYKLRSNASKDGHTGEVELGIEPTAKGHSRIRQGDSDDDLHPRWIRYVRRLGIVAVAALFVGSAVGGLSVGVYIVAGAFLVLFVLPFSVMVLRSRLTMDTRDTGRRLLLSIRANTLPDTNIFPNLHWRDTRSIEYSGRLMSGHLSLETGGMLWTPSRPFLPRIIRTTFISGEMSIPWSWIESIAIGREARMLLPIGGYVTIELSDDRGSIEGRYLGSRPLFTKALQGTPLGGER